MACGGSFGHDRALVFLSRLRFFSPNTAVVVRPVVSPTTALRLFSQSRTPTRDVTHSRRAAARIRSYVARVQSAVSAFIEMSLLDPRTTPPTLASRRVR